MELAERVGYFTRESFDQSLEVITRNVIIIQK